MKNSTHSNLTDFRNGDYANVPVKGPIDILQPVKQQNTGKFLTPLRIKHMLGAFDIDPYAPLNRPWLFAPLHFNPEENGIMQTWYGRIWLDLPTNILLAEKFIKRMAFHNNGVMLVRVNHANKCLMSLILRKASSLLLLCCGTKHKDKFVGRTIVVTFGQKNVEGLNTLLLDGEHIHLNNKPSKQKSIYL